MSRSGYSDEYDSQQLNIWRGAVERAILGNRGQAFLREMRDALDAMPIKRLTANELSTPDGEVCAMGAVGRKRGVDMSKIDPEDRDAVASMFDIAPALVAEIAYLNDEEGQLFKDDAEDDAETPEQRFERIRKWVELQIPEDAAEAKKGEKT